MAVSGTIPGFDLRLEVDEGIDRIDEDAPAALLVHTGATLLLSDEAQLDAHVGAGLSDTAPELLVGVGASVRL